MNYKDTVQHARKKFLRQRKLSQTEIEIIEKDFDGKDYTYYKSIKDKDFFLPERYSADTTYHKIKQTIQPGISSLSLLKYAAVIISLTIITFGVYHLNKAPGDIFISTLHGERKQIELPDGSTVILNSLSSVSYPEKIQKGRTREIKLDGEAYFDIVKNSQIPFIVKASGIEVKVLGTKFNVSAYKNDENITTSLYEGAVAISSDSGETIRLEPGKQAAYNKKTNNIELFPITNEHQSTWINGSMYFENISLKEILKILEREKNITFKISDEINKELKLTAKFTHNESVEDILEYLSQSGEFTFEKKENIYTINKQKH
ncbi:MAG: FecR domain-containing protein [Tannerella sp.]|jgi:ferric-dicitrate binding protein FerR (iron transport regulator)|nr:FecR domain-containing protein [Tannerella sp.]